MKFVILLALLCILASLASALYFLIKDPGDSKRTVQALTWRVALSLALFIFLIVAFAMGWVKPHSFGTSPPIVVSHLN